DRAMATGIGCGFTSQDALAKARDTAAFNLRTVTGQANYRVSYQVLRNVPDPSQVCVEVRAQATPEELR
ncbi:MAG TPA: hypothetical protein VL359_09725, partial [bacterium]|nr:hypothetical protein [bacterium]